MELIAVVMGAETSQDRFGSCKQLLDYGFAGFALLCPKPEGTHTVPVTLGTTDTVTAVPGDELRLLIDKSQLRDVRVEVYLEEQVAAPVSKGQKLGEITVYCGQQILARIPMVAKEGVAKRSWWQIFWSLVQKCWMGQ